MAVKKFQALSLLVILSVAANCNLIADGAGTPRPDQVPGFYKIFNSEGYLTATADGKVTRTPKGTSQSPEGSSWLVQCNQDGGNCDIAALDPPPTWQFYGRLEARTGAVLESFPPQGFVDLNLNITDTSPSQWNIRPAVPGGGWYITWNLPRGQTGYLTGEYFTYIRPVVAGEEPGIDQIPGEDALWFFEEIDLGSA